MKTKLESFLKYVQNRVTSNINKYIPGKASYPPVIYDAMHYSISTGKRIRPALIYAVYNLDNKKNKTKLYDMDILSTCIEMIHTYSLIHDDLPGMDNDDLRRGKPTVHKKYNEAIAILTGDAFLTYNFELLTFLKTKNKISIIRNIAENIGTNGMIGGQVVDTESAFKKFSKPHMKKLLGYIHRKKTAALIRTSIVSAGIGCGFSKTKIEKLYRYGELLGISFQIIDDILDVEGDEKTLGKTKSDIKNEKLTFPFVYGLEYSKKTAFNMIEEAKNELESFGDRAKLLNNIADFIFFRKY